MIRRPVDVPGLFICIIDIVPAPNPLTLYILKAGNTGVSANTNPAKVINLRACDGLPLLLQSSQITQLMYSVHIAGSETINANTVSVRHSLTAVQSSWPVFVL